MNDEQTPALRQAVENMATMREAYDNLSQAAEAYNTGKPELAANITAKGVQASATETLPELAEKVAAISQEPIEIDGGEMFEKQIYGSPTNIENVGGVYVQNGGALWNLYEVMAQLLSDGRFVQYGGILLAEYFKGYDTIELMNVGAGGAYFTCDGDLYFTDKGSGDPHVWHDNDNGMMNRWVAYLFAGESTNYTIPSTELCPRSIHIGRKVGTINCSVAGRIREIVVTDGNELTSTNFTSTQVWQQEVVIKNIVNFHNTAVKNNSTVVSLYIQAENIDQTVLDNSNTNLTALYLDVENMTFDRILYVDYGQMYVSDFFFAKDPIFNSIIRSGNSNTTYPKEYIHIHGINNLKGWVFLLEHAAMDGVKTVDLGDVETISSGGGVVSVMSGYNGAARTLARIIGKKVKHIYGFIGAKRTPALKDIEVGAVDTNFNLANWDPTTVLSTPEGIAEINANIRDHIAANVADGNNTLTFTVSTNLLNNLEQATLDAFAAKHWLVAGA